MIEIKENDADYIYCVACGESWQNADIFSVVCDNMMFRLCRECLKDLRKQLNDMEL